MKLEIILYFEIPKNTIARIWLPKICIDKNKLFQSLGHQTPEVLVEN